MSELQISLLTIGFLVVAGVYGFNRFQEWKYRRRAAQAFPSGHKDVLLQEGKSDLRQKPEARKFREEPRIEPVVSALTDDWADEPMLEPEISRVAGEARMAPAHARAEKSKTITAYPESRQAAPMDEAIEYVVQLHSDEPVGGAALAETLQRLSGLAGKRIRWYGMNLLTGGWEEVGQDDAAEYHHLVVTLQLADRSGPVSEHDLLAFCGQVQAVADELVAIAEFPDRRPALAKAMALDQFGADVDVLIGVNVITPDGDAFAATKVRALAEAAGMTLQPDGMFHFFNDQGADLFSLGNLDSTPFSPENIRQLVTHGITFLFDVPKVADGVRAFSQMLVVARQMATSLEGQVVDDNRRALTDAGIAKIKDQLAGIYTRMDEQQIRGGSVRALRLFS